MASIDHRHRMFAFAAVWPDKSVGRAVSSAKATSAGSDLGRSSNIGC
jgi:hypothetical protein